MSSYIAFDLDALNKAPAVARAAGLDPDAAIGGMARLWEFCWRAKTDLVTKIQIRGLMNEALIEPLEAFGFLAADADQWRVKGADRYLRVSSARSENGKKAAANGNLKRGSTGPTAKESAPTASQQSPSSAPTEPQQLPSPSASSEQRAANSEHQKTTTSAVDKFWVATQADRETAFKLVRERPPQPRALSKWFNEATLEVRGDISRLEAAWGRFRLDPYWVDRGLPWAGFVSQWRKFTPPEAPPKPPACPLCEVLGASGESSGPSAGTKRVCYPHYGLLLPRIREANLFDDDPKVDELINAVIQENAA